MRNYRDIHLSASGAHTLRIHTIETEDADGNTHSYEVQVHHWHAEVDQ